MADKLSDEIAMPGFGTGTVNENYRIRYYKVDLDDVEQLAELERIETLGIRGKEVVLLGKDKFTFMERYFIILSYAEKTPDA